MMEKYSLDYSCIILTLNIAIFIFILFATDNEKRRQYTCTIVNSCLFISGVEFWVTFNNHKMYTFDLLILKGDTLPLLIVYLTINNHKIFD